MYSEKDIETITSLANFPVDSENFGRYSSPYVIVKDNCFNDIIENIYNDVQIIKNHVRPARMNRGNDEFLDESIRGDSICWITSKLCKELNLNGLDEYIKRLIHENQVFKEYLGLEDDDYNIQFAIYPGKGEGYNRHRDAFPNNDEIKTSRQLTILLYLNKDWETDDGGQLRIFTFPGISIDGLGDGFSFWGVNGYDINPIFGRMVIFRSELVEHAVLPCFKYERIALTFWAHGKGPIIPNEKLKIQIDKNNSIFQFSSNQNVDDNDENNSD